MKTTLPTLSYSPTGVLWSEDFHSSGTKERAFPRTDLEHFDEWNTFETDIDQAITTRMLAMDIPLDAEYDIGPLSRRRPRVVNEEDVRCQARTQLHELVIEVLYILGIQRWFSSPTTGNNQIIGEPDFSWLRDSTMHPKVVVEYKTKWAAPLEDLPAYFRKAQKNVRERQSMDAVFQLYGYMAFNENKYGILNNMEYAWFFQRVETAESQGKTLQYYGPIKFDASDSPSMLKAFVGIVLLAETASSTWFHSSPTPANAPASRYVGTGPTDMHNRNAAIKNAQSYRSVVVAGSYQVLPLDPRLCHFHRSSVRHAPRRGCTLKATLLRGILAGNLNVFCKIVGLFQGRDTISLLDMEVRNYATLQGLQGIVIPRVHGYYEVWGLLRLLALEDVGTAIPEDREISTRTKTLMKSALARIHSAGYVHGDIARRNFCKKADMVFLVDLETLALGSPAERAVELAQIDAL